MRPIVVDCNNLCHIALHTMGDLSYREEATGVVFGFFRSLLTIANKFQSQNFYLCWDSRWSIRQKIYPEYKMKRIERKKEMTEVERRKYFSMVAQAKELHTEILPRLGFNNNFLRAGFESDDLMAYIVFNYDNDPYVDPLEDKWLMVTADNDMYQCLDHCDIYNPQTKKMMDGTAFRKKYQISPRQWAMAKAIGGCSSDNVAGVQGVGDPKSPSSMALKFLRGELKPESKVYKRIEASTDIINRNLELVSLPLHGLRTPGLNANSFDARDFREFFDDKHFVSFLRDMKKWEVFFNAG